jgi:hypothetical protein
LEKEEYRSKRSEENIRFIDYSRNNSGEGCVLRSAKVVLGIVRDVMSSLLNFIVFLNTL